MKVTTVVMPGIFDMKDDDEFDDSPYRPLPFAFGDPCEPCWLTIGLRNLTDSADWSSHDDAIEPIGGIFCTHATVTP